MSFQNTRVIRWTNEECLAWINSLESTSNINPEVRIALYDDVKVNKMTGDELLDACASKDDVIEFLEERLPNMKKLQATRICKAMVAALKLKGDDGNTFLEEDFSSPGTEGSKAPGTISPFTVFVSFKKKTIKIPNMTSKHTILELKKFIGDAENPTIAKYPLFYGCILQDRATLGSYNIRNETVVNVLIRNNGGTSSKAVNRRHINYSEYSYIKKTRKPDCLFGYTFAEGYSVTQMPCGHVMEAESMYKYIESIFAKNLHSKVVINCPLPKCKTAWDFQLCCRVAGMSDEEYVRNCRRKEIHGRDDVRECPHCQSLCKRKTNVAILRVTCGECKGKDWCWVCAKVWKGDSLMVCNNSECPFVSALNKQLSSCKKTVPYGWENITIPAGKSNLLPDIRACPGCLQLTLKPPESSSCKHMTCKSCAKQFCFACLRDGSVCTHSNYADYCFVHPAQHFS